MRPWLSQHPEQRNLGGHRRVSQRWGRKRKALPKVKAEDSPEEERLKGSNTSRAAGIRKLQQFVDKADADINA